MLDTLAPPDLAQNHCFIFVKLRRDDQCHWLANNFFRFVLEHPLGAGIPTPDDAIQIFTGDCVLRRFDNCRQPRHRFLGLAPPGDLCFQCKRLLLPLCNHAQTLIF